MMQQLLITLWSKASESFSGYVIEIPFELHGEEKAKAIWMGICALPSMTRKGFSPIINEERMKEIALLFVITNIYELN